MAVYYNEIDPFAVQRLRRLMAAGHIAAGVVDERSIEDVYPDDLRGFTQCHFFAGVGVWSHALRLAGWPDDRPVWTGSCPCQPFSAVGKGLGVADERHLWPAWHWLIRLCRPGTIFGEQVASTDALAWLDLVQADMEGEGYTCGALDLCAAGFGAPHIRQRLYWTASIDGLGDTFGAGLERYAGHGDGETGRQEPAGSASATGKSCESGYPGPTNGFWRDADWLFCRDGKWRPVEPGTSPLAHGVAQRVGRIRTCGNAIVAPVAAAFVDAARQARQKRLVLGETDGQGVDRWRNTP